MVWKAALWSRQLAFVKHVLGWLVGSNAIPSGAGLLLS